MPSPAFHLPAALARTAAAAAPPATWSLCRARPSASTFAHRRPLHAPPPSPPLAPQRTVVARQQHDAQGREYIRLDGFLKIQGMASTGGQAKMLIQDGMVDVNGETEVRRGKKLRHGDTVQLRGDAAALEVLFE